MTAALMAWTPWIAVGLAIVVAGLMRWLDRPARDAWLSMAPLVALLPLAAVIVRPDIGPTWSPLITAVVIGSLARQRDDLLHSECALKLLWVMGVSFALSAAGLALLTLATGTPRNEEQWAVLDMGLDPSFLWMTALPLSMLSGLVLLGGAPFHFWAADLIQGARPWIGPLAVVALQVSGLSWLVARLRGIAAFTAAAQVADGLLTVAAGAAFVVGSVTLIFQRRPERRVGTLASLHGALHVGIARGAVRRAHGGLRARIVGGDVERASRAGARRRRHRHALRSRVIARPHARRRAVPASSGVGRGRALRVVLARRRPRNAGRRHLARGRARPRAHATAGAVAAARRRVGRVLRGGHAAAARGVRHQRPRRGPASARAA